MKTTTLQFIEAVERHLLPALNEHRGGGAVGRRVISFQQGFSALHLGQPGYEAGAEEFDRWATVGAQTVHPQRSVAESEQQAFTCSLHWCPDDRSEEQLVVLETAGHLDREAAVLARSMLVLAGLPVPDLPLPRVKRVRAEAHPVEAGHSRPPMLPLDDGGEPGGGAAALGDDDVSWTGFAQDGVGEAGDPGDLGDLGDPGDPGGPGAEDGAGGTGPVGDGKGAPADGAEEDAGVDVDPEAGALAGVAEEPETIPGAG